MGVEMLPPADQQPYCSWSIDFSPPWRPDSAEKPRKASSQAWQEAPSKSTGNPYVLWQINYSAPWRPQLEEAGAAFTSYSPEQPYCLRDIRYTEPSQLQPPCRRSAPPPTPQATITVEKPYALWRVHYQPPWRPAAPWELVAAAFQANGNKVKQSFATTAPKSPSDPEWVLHEPVTDLDKRDKGSPDGWIPRNPQLKRLTGRHPLNAETPLGLLEKGLVTPTSLHYVRNHGRVPQLYWERHQVEVRGEVVRPLVLSMDQLAALPTVDVTCTLVCVGNRRKEVGLVREAKGFAWGPGAVGTSTWTGVRLSHLLLAAGLKWPQDTRGMHVCFNGVPGEVRQGRDGSYGTSISLAKAMDDANDIIVAYQQNGALLMPDHGFPARIIVPGHIAGRMVKWLSSIIITRGDSDNFYHYHDHRLLPSHVDDRTAREEGWWYKPEYIVNELNINSVITSPANEELIDLSTAPPAYTLKGYAYAGGGMEVVRVEVSLDGGALWRLAQLRRTGEPNAAGKHWCWVHWALDVPLVELLRVEEVMCRAWDSAMNTQPAGITWNLMGVMNNATYRLKLTPTVTAAGALALRFEHPTVPGPAVGGWMQRPQVDEDETGSGEVWLV